MANIFIATIAEALLLQHCCYDPSRLRHLFPKPMINVEELFSCQASRHKNKSMLDTPNILIIMATGPPQLKINYWVAGQGQSQYS
jgi:hypothetical protein